MYGSGRKISILSKKAGGDTLMEKGRVWGWYRSLGQKNTHWGRGRYWAPSLEASGGKKKPLLIYKTAVRGNFSLGFWNYSVWERPQQMGKFAMTPLAIVGRFYAGVYPAFWWIFIRSNAPYPRNKKFIQRDPRTALFSYFGHRWARPRSYAPKLKDKIIPVWS